MIADSKQTFKEFLDSYAVRQKKPERRQVRRQQQPFFQITNYDPQQNSIQIEQNFSYVNSRSQLPDLPLNLRFKTLESERSELSVAISTFKINKWKHKDKPFSLIRNQELFNDCVRRTSKFQSQSQKQLVPIKPIQSKNDIVKGYLLELQRKRKDAPKPQGRDELLDLEVDSLYLDITRRDAMLSVKFPTKLLPNVKNVFRNLLATGYDQQMFLDLPRLRSVHLGMQLTRAHFFKFKYHFLKKFMHLNIPTEKMFNCCERIENIRPYILNEILEYEIYGGEDGIKCVTKSMYKKILSDVTLAPYFEKIDVATQELKFARLFFQLIYHLDSPNYSCETLRERHVKYQLTNVQLTNFKYYLSLTLQQAGIPWKNIRQLLRRMDIYKYAIINKDDLQFHVNQVGFNQFIENFVNSCSQDALLSDLISKRGRNRFTSHCCNIFHYFFRYNIKAITKEDIHLIHSKKAIITEKVFDRFRTKAIQAVKNLTNDPVILEDFIEDWDEVKPIVLGETREQNILFLGEDVLIQRLLSILEYEFVQRHLNQVYDTEEADMSSSILCKLNLLLYGVRFFKKLDLRVIHSRFKITSAQYYDFQQCFKVALEGYSRLNYVHQLIEEYEDYIVSD